MLKQTGEMIFTAISALFYNRDLKSTIRPPEKMISATQEKKRAEDRIEGKF